MPRKLRAHPRVRCDAPVVVARDDARKQLGVRDTADVDEDRRDGDWRRLPTREVEHTDALDASVAQDLLDDRTVPDLDVGALGHSPGVGLLAGERLGLVDQNDADVVRSELEGLELRALFTAAAQEQGFNPNWPALLAWAEKWVPTLFVPAVLDVIAGQWSALFALAAAQGPECVAELLVALGITVATP